MKLLVNFLTIASLTIFLSSANDIQPKIVNGTDAEIAEFPFVVALKYNERLSCAGSLLNDLWIVTAAHCLYAPAENLTIEYSTTEISDGFTGTKEAEVEKIIPHEDYDSRAIRNDIGLVKLKYPLDTGLHGSVAKIAVPGRYYQTGTPTTVVGWGRIGSGLPISKVLQKVDLQIYSYADCRAAHSVSGFNLDIYRTNICAGVPVKKYFWMKTKL